ncbi:MAG: serine protease [Burkholderiales bacterium]|nr:serine protease [Burkholderiales bacterium]
MALSNSMISKTFSPNRGNAPMSTRQSGAPGSLFVIAAMIGMVACADAYALTPEEVFERVSPSIWTVQTYDAKGRPIAQGSAVVVEPGRLVTNCHVLARSQTVRVAKDNVSYGASLEFPDPKRDLCQLAVRNFHAPAARLGTIKALKVGQRVYAIGSPFGLELSMTEGIISSLRDVDDGSPLIQTNATISKGSSGGGLFDGNGQLVGLTTFSVKDAQSLNFAIPADWILELPERGKATLAKRAEEAAAAASGKGESGATGATQWTKMTGEAFTAFFAMPRTLDRVAHADSMRIEFRNGIFNASGTGGGRFSRTGGRYTINGAANQICIQMVLGTTVSEQLWSDLVGCFELYRGTDNTFRLSAVGRTYDLIVASPYGIDPR